MMQPARLTTAAEELEALADAASAIARRIRAASAAETPEREPEPEHAGVLHRRRPRLELADRRL